MKTHCPIRTKYLPNLLYHFRLIGIFGTNIGYTLIASNLYLIPIHLIFFIRSGLRVGFFLRRGYKRLIRNTLADSCRLTYLQDFLAIHTRVLIDKSVEDFLLYRVVSNLLNVVQTYKEDWDPAEWSGPGPHLLHSCCSSCIEWWSFLRNLFYLLYGTVHGVFPFLPCEGRMNTSGLLKTLHCGLRTLNMYSFCINLI